MDPQGNATTSLGVDPRSLSLSIYDVLIDQAPIQKAITLTERVGLDLVPATTDLAGAEVEMARMMARTPAGAPLHPLLDDYDYILVDEPPSPGPADHQRADRLRQRRDHPRAVRISCPGGPEPAAAYDTAGARRAQRTARQLGVVLTMYDSRTNLAQQVVQEVRQYFPGVVFKTIIPRNVRLSEAPTTAKPS